MSVRVALHHATRYTYDRPIRLGTASDPPAAGAALPHADRSRTSSTVRPAEPLPQLAAGPAGELARARARSRSRPTISTSPSISSRTLAVINPFDFFLEASAERYPFAYDPALALELAPYLAAEPSARRSRRIWRGSTARERRDHAVHLRRSTRELQRDIGYLIRMEPGVQTPDETLEKRAGSCRDSAWLLVQLLRRLGLAARFASGYLIQLKPDVTAARRTVGRDARFHRSARLVRSLLARRGLGRTRSDVRPVCGRGTHPARVRGRTRPRRRRSRGTVDPCEVTFGFEMSVSACTSRRASPSRTRTRSGPRSTGSAIASTRRCNERDVR